MAYLDESGLSRFWTHIMTKLGGKVDKEEGKGLSTNDFTTTEKEKLAGLNDITVDSAMSSSSTNPVQNKIINSALSNKAPTNHASTGTTYGMGDYDNFGHVKLIQSPLHISEDGENWLDAEDNVVASADELMNGTTGLAASAFAVSALSQIFSVEVDDINNQISEIAGGMSNKYTKPSAGIPASDLASAVQTSLGKADTSIQSLDGYATEEYVTNNAVSKSGDTMTGNLRINKTSTSNDTANVTTVLTQTDTGDASEAAVISGADRAALEYKRTDSNGAIQDHNWIAVYDKYAFLYWSPNIVGNESNHYIATTKAVAEYVTDQIIVSSTEPAVQEGKIWLKPV